jgi:hypothetical protein
VDLLTKGETLTEEHRFSRIDGGCSSVDNPTQKYNLSRNPMKGRPGPTQGCQADDDDDIKQSQPFSTSKDIFIRDSLVLRMIAVITEHVYNK